VLVSQQYMLFCVSDVLLSYSMQTKFRARLARFLFLVFSSRNCQLLFTVMSTIELDDFLRLLCRFGHKKPEILNQL
jgi:hypothetical protein